MKIIITKLIKLIITFRNLKSTLIENFFQLHYQNHTFVPDFNAKTTYLLNNKIIRSILILDFLTLINWALGGECSEKMAIGYIPTHFDFIVWMLQ